MAKSIVTFQLNPTSLITQNQSSAGVKQLSYDEIKESELAGCGGSGIFLNGSLSDRRFETLISVVESNCALKKIRISECVLVGDTRDRFLDLINALIEHRELRLESLDLSSTGITKNEVGEIVRLIEAKSSIEEINLSGNNLEDEGILELSELIKTKKTIQKLNISNTNFGLEGIIALSSILEDRDSPITVLNLERSDISGDQVVERLSEAISKNNSLQALNITSTVLSIGFSNEILDAIIRNSSIKKLNFLGNIFEGESINSLLNIIQNKDIESLTLSGPYLNDDFASILSKIIAESLSLKELHLKDTILSDIGAIELGTALESNDSLEKLLIIGSNIADEGARFITESVRKNNALKKFDLLECNISQSTANELQIAFIEEDQSFRMVNITSADQEECEIPYSPNVGGVGYAFTDAFDDILDEDLENNDSIILGDILSDNDSQ